mmetsp:Transcript_44466/g.141568  ORF Transcript_44466/g.141568 Transcript_44466/m.141568 type:complete len:207 (-) Transcript_44466:763-1383(-)
MQARMPGRPPPQAARAPGGRVPRKQRLCKRLQRIPLLRAPRQRREVQARAVDGVAPRESPHEGEIAHAPVGGKARPDHHRGRDEEPEGRRLHAVGGLRALGGRVAHRRKEAHERRKQRGPAASDHDGLAVLCREPSRQSKYARRVHSPHSPQQHNGRHRQVGHEQPGDAFHGHQHHGERHDHQHKHQREGDLRPHRHLPQLRDTES